MAGDKKSPDRPPHWRSEKAVGESLRDQYKQVLNEPVPEKLQKLIEALKEIERKQDSEDE